MSDISPVFNAALKVHGAPPISQHGYSPDRLDEFLKEAYSINARIADLTAYLRTIRPSYLSTAPAPRSSRRHDAAHGQRDATQRHLSDTERAAIDAEAKGILRQLYSAVEHISSIEKIRSDTTTEIERRKRARGGGFGALGRWAAGDAITERSVEEVEQEAKQKMVSAHREGVILFLSNKLQEAGTLQASMMETRIQRDIEKSKSVLYKTKGVDIPYGDKDFPRPNSASLGPSRAGTGQNPEAEPQLTQEQMQLFAEENQSMLKHYEDTLSQVRNAEKSLIEISELQSTLVANLEVQNAHIDQLVQDSFFTEENVGRGNKELKRASERASTARILFHSTCAFCIFLVVWDLVF